MSAPGRIHRGLSIAALAALAFVIAARTQACEVPLSSTGAHAAARQIVKIIDGETLKLADGAELRLVGVQVPARRSAGDAKAALAALALGKQVWLAPENAPRDRYGRLLAQIFVGEGPGTPAELWLQGRLVELGLARVETRKENRACAAELLALEEKARAAKQGLWALAVFAIRSADAIPREDIGTFELVEGIVHDVATVGGRTYINFGPDWKTDFTVTIEARDRKLFAADALKPEALRGRKTRVRGWVEWWNGPMIAVDLPEEIEMLP
jgi:endonuclease YncB( thermonuclease family)